MQINALLSGFSPVPARGGAGNLPSVANGAEVRARQEQIPADVFEQGQGWKNLAVAGSTAVTGGRQCACGSCPACGAQAYAKQAGAKDAPTLSSPVFAGKENGVAEASKGNSGKPAAAGTTGQQGRGQEVGAPVKEKTLSASGPKGPDGEALSQAEQLQVAELEVIDTKVRAHEMAHLAAAGSYATGGASFQYAKGPDGKQYAVGGEVGIDTGKESTPEATISKMQTVRAAALAPADPSPQDQKVAARASLVISEVSHELQMTRLEQSKGKVENKQAGQAESDDKASPQAEKNPSAPEDRAEQGVPGQKPSVNTQKVAATIAGLTRQAAQIHIAV